MFRLVIICILILIILPFLYKVILNTLRKVGAEINSNDNIKDAYADYKNKKNILNLTIKRKEENVEKEINEINKTKENIKNVD